MPTGLSTSLANSFMNMLRQVAFTAPAGTFIAVHIGDPGAAGTANPSAVTTRQAATFAAAASGGLGILSNSPAFNMTASETITHISVWDTVSGGSFLWSGALGVAKPVANTDVLTITAVTLALGTAS